MTRFMRYEWAATAAFTLFPLMLLGIRRRRNLRPLLPLLILAALATTLTACGASQYPYSTAPGTYTRPRHSSRPSHPGRRITHPDRELHPRRHPLTKPARQSFTTQRILPSGSLNHTILRDPSSATWTSPSILTPQTSAEPYCGAATSTVKPATKLSRRPSGPQPDV
jgi:hypothetical protein